MLRAVVTLSPVLRAIGAPLSVLLLVGVIVVFDFFRWRRPFLLALSVVLFVATAGFTVGSWILPQTEEGRWAALTPDSPAAEHIDFLRDFPSGPHSGEAELRVRTRQQEVVVRARRTSAPDLVVLLEELAAQDLPPRLHLVFRPNAACLAEGTEKSRVRYEQSRERFEAGFQEHLATAIRPLGAEVDRQETAPAPYDRLTILLVYRLHWGAEFTQTPSMYRFRGIEADGAWAVYLPGEETPAHGEVLAREAAPARPDWEGSKSPERVIGDLVLGRLLDTLRSRFGDR